MAFKHGRATVVLGNEFNLSAYLRSHTVAGSVDLPPTSTYGATAVRRQVVGLKDGDLTLGGFHDTTAGGTWSEFSAALAESAASTYSIGVEGTTIGLPATMASGRAESIDLGSEVDAAIETTLNVKADGGTDYGVWLHALAATTATGNGTSVDGGAATTNGGVGHLHVTAASGTSPTLDAVVADSADDVSFATILTFAQKTAAGFEAVAITGNVRRYTRCTRTIGGTGPSFTFAVAFARR